MKTGLFCWMLLLASLPLTGQERNVMPQDNHLWLGASVEKKFSKKWEGSFTGMTRFQNNFATWRMAYADVTVSYRISKHFSVSPGYRLLVRPQNNAHRFYLDFAGRFSRRWGKFNFILAPRLRFQEQYVAGTGSFHLRTRLKLSLDRKRWIFRPFVAYEAYWGINPEYQDLDRNRFSIGTEVELGKRTSLSLYYIRQIPYHARVPVRVNVFAGMFTLAL